MSAPAKVKTALLLQAAWFASVPALNEIFYWLSGMPYTWAATFSLLCLAGVIHALRSKKRGVFFCLLCLCVFFNGMNLEQVCVMQIVVLFFLTLYFVFSKERTSAITAGILFLTAAAAFFAMYSAPGTAIRMAGGEGFSSMTGRLLRTFIIAGSFGGVTLLKFFSKPIVYVFLLYLPNIAQNTAPCDEKISSRLRAWHIAASVAFIAPFMQSLAGFTTGSGLPQRGDGLTIWIMGAAWIFLWAFGYRNDAAFKRIRSFRIYRWREALLALCLLFSGNFISLLRDLPLTFSYAAEMKEREAAIIQQKNEDKTDIIVPLLTAKPGLVFYSDITPVHNFWKNQDLAKYLEVNSIIALPAALLNDEEKSKAFLAGGVDIWADMGPEPAGPKTADSQLLLAELYDPRFAPGLTEASKDYSAAFRWYKEAAYGGNAAAQRRLSGFYTRGLSVPKNYIYAIGWLLRSQF